MKYGGDLLDHYRRPRNTGDLDEGVSAEGENPGCGDHMEVSVKVDDGVVKEVRHRTEACAVATAGISIASGLLEGMEAGEVLELDRDWMLEELDSDISPMRVKCAVLGLKTVQSALENRPE